MDDTYPTMQVGCVVIEAVEKKSSLFFLVIARALAKTMYAFVCFSHEYATCKKMVKQQVSQEKFSLQELSRRNHTWTLPVPKYDRSRV